MKQPTYNDTLFYPLPLSMRRLIAHGCDCHYCKEHRNIPPMWDTLAVNRDKVTDTWAVHYPELAAQHGRMVRA